MRATRLCCFLLTLLCLTTHTYATKEIALTIDDLPFVGESKNFHLNRIIDSLNKAGIPATGFIIAGNVSQDNIPVLERFRSEGYALGNHTLNHVSANQVSTEQYLYQIDEADKRLQRVLTTPKYFRFPYLAMGQGSKKTTILEHLRAAHYTIAPITIDSKDFMFNQQLLAKPEAERRAFFEELKPVYLDYIWLKTREAAAKHPHKAYPEILLIHANLLNAYCLDDIIAMLKNEGYQFVSLDKALHNS